MRRVFVFAGMALALFLGLSVIENLERNAPFAWGPFAFDLIESGLLALAIVSTAFVALDMRDMRRDRAQLLNDLARARADGDKWRAASRTHLEGLGRAMREQFNAWGLTDGEAEIALLMLKGLSHKEIARLRDTSEATVRQQAASIYRKSRLSSRAELSAYFLEDLLSPATGGNGQDAPRIALVERGS